MACRERSSPPGASFRQVWVPPWLKNHGGTAKQVVHTINRIDNDAFRFDFVNDRPIQTSIPRKGVSSLASNQEQAIYDAAKTGDPIKVAAAYAAYKTAMEREHQTPKPLSYFAR